MWRGSSPRQTERSEVTGWRTEQPPQKKKAAHHHRGDRNSRSMKAVDLTCAAADGETEKTVDLQQKADDQ